MEKQPALFRLSFILFVISTTQAMWDNSTCPKMCKCSPHLRTVSCINKNLTSVPDGIPFQVTELYLSYNKITTLPASSFKGLRNLTKLDLKNNMLQGIQPGAFSDLESLNELYLTRNQLTGIKPEALKGLSGLKSFYCGQNKLAAVPTLEYMPSLKELTLDQNKISSAKITTGKSVLCNLSRVDLGQNPIIVLKKDDFSELLNSSVTSFDMNHCQLKSVENGTFLPFIKLQSLSLSYNYLNTTTLQNIVSSLKGSQLSSLELSSAIISHLPSDIFIPLRNVPLTNLKLQHCSLTVLLNKTFEPLPHLLHLYLDYSKIAAIENGTFTPLTKLQSLALQHNGLNDIPVPIPASVKTMDLSYNYGIQRIPKDSFSPNSQLDTLSLSVCSLSQVYKGSFRYLTKLTSLDLSRNALQGTSIAKGSFTNMSSLQVLDLSQNKLSQIKNNVGMLYGLSNLSMLNMSNNECFELPLDIFNPLRMLKTLDLRKNSLDKMLLSDKHGHLFSSLNMLETLILEENGIVYLSSNVFRGLINTASIFLRNNRVTQWDSTTFSNTTNLKILDLSTNLVSVVNSSDVENFNSNLSLNLNDNPFACWCDLIWFREWLNTTDVNILIANEYECSSPPEMAGRPLFEFDPQSIATKCHPPYWKWILIASVIVLVLCVVIGSLIYRCRWKIALCCYRTQKRCCAKQSSPDREPLIGGALESNATLIHVQFGNSCEWVREVLSRKLREEFHLSLFTEEDILGGTGYSNQIGMMADAMKESKFIFPIISVSYMKEGKYDYTSDVVSQTLDSSRDTKRVIVIIFPDSSIGSEARIRAYIRHKFRRRVRDEHVLYWGDDNDTQSYFWERLQNAIEG